MKRYEILEHTADVGLKAYGKTVAQAFENVAIGMVDLISDTKKVTPVGGYEIKLQADDLEQLLVDWLSELLYLQDSQEVLFGKFVVEVEEKNCKLKAKVYGERFDARKHPRGVEIKAVTYHLLEVNREQGYVTVLFDI